MTFSAYDSHPHKGTPVELYLFEFGNDRLAYTNADEDILFNGVTYKAEPIVRDRIFISGRNDKSSVKLTISTRSRLADLLRNYPPSDVIAVTIWQGHLDDPDQEFKVVWKGRVLSMARKGVNVEMQMESILVSFNRHGLRRNYQIPCTHVLFDQWCKANEAAATTATTAASVGPNHVIPPNGWNPHPLEKYKAGKVRWDGPYGPEHRMILNVDTASGKLLLSGPTVGLVAGQPIDVTLGCNHRMDDCQNLFNNIMNYGGCPWMPMKSPFRGNQFN